MDDKKRVFISYSTKDSDIVEKALDFLKSKGVSCWFAPNEIPGGGNFAERITNGLSNADMVLLMFSKDAQSSEYVNQEVETAFYQNIPILAFNLDDTIPGSQKDDGILGKIKSLFSSNTGSNMGFFLRNTQWLYAYPNPEEHFNQLYEDVTRILSDLDKGIYTRPQVDYGNDDDSEIHNPGFFEKNRNLIIAALVILILCIGFIGYTSLNSSSNENLNETSINIDYIGLADDGVSYYVYGNVSCTLNDTSNYKVQIDFYDNSNKIVETNTTKLKNIADNTICQAIVDSKVSKVSVKLLDNNGKVICSSESKNIIK